MLEIDEDDILVGSPRSKFFDVLLNSNRNVIEDALDKSMTRFAAMEILLQEILESEFEGKIQNVIYERMDEVEINKNDFYINLVGDILSQHE